MTRDVFESFNKYGILVKEVHEWAIFGHCSQPSSLVNRKLRSIEQESMPHILQAYVWFSNKFSLFQLKRMEEVTA